LIVLNTQQLTALRNLAGKQSGEDVGFINIADARTLTELGLAERTRQGWQITAAGKALLVGPGSS
jgi:glutamine cyclotransferase